MRSNMKLNIECGKPTCHGFLGSPDRYGHRGVSAVSRVCRKYRLVEHKKRKQQMREYRNLKSILPTINQEARVSKVDVVEEAIKYIDFLHAEIAARLNNAHGNHGSKLSATVNGQFLPANIMRNQLTQTSSEFTQNNNRKHSLAEIRIRL